MRPIDNIPGANAAGICIHPSYCRRRRQEKNSPKNGRHVANELTLGRAARRFGVPASAGGVQAFSRGLNISMIILCSMSAPAKAVNSMLQMQATVRWQTLTFIPR